MAAGQGDRASAEALRAERARVALLYSHLDAQREQARDGLERARSAAGDGGTRQSRVEAQVSEEEYARRIAQLDAVDSGLCFGRTDDTAGTTLYVGRIGLRDADYEPLLVDWRADAARPFYTASPKAPQNLVRRRHLHTRGRTVTGLDDELFGGGGSVTGGLSGEAALLTALRRSRTGRMTDVVATIQAEQDRVIRSGLPGVLVVQGGPGTGKTVAALHRAAYLLYTHRATLDRRGVLVVAPNATFLRYIDQVLPSLGETEVVLATLGELYPGVTATAEDPPAAAVVKGSPRMATVVRQAVRDQQRDPGRAVEIPLTDTDLTLCLPREVCLRARARARALEVPHNVARKRLVTDLLNALVHDQAARLDRPVDEEELRHAPAELWRQPTVRAALDALWPPLSPEGLVGRLLSHPPTLDSAAAEVLTPAEQAALLRPADAPWTVGDVPLLDEAAELLGVDDSAERARRRAAAEERRAEEEYAHGVLQIVGLAGQVDAAWLAERQRADGPARTTAERAAGDRTWAYGHVIVDEAQELSPMAWRTVMRRVPTRSMTVVGDVAQTGSPAGARSWESVLDAHVAGRWRQERLTVNYRTPAEVMELASAVLAEVAPNQSAPRSVRAEGEDPRLVEVDPRRLPERVAELVDEALTAFEEHGGRLAVIAPDHLLPGLSAALPRAARGTDRRALDHPAVLLGTREAKGLEFDHVVLADPAGILAQSANGGHDLYVALTRVTRRLTVVCAGEVPAVLRRARRPEKQRGGAAGDGSVPAAGRAGRGDPGDGGGALSGEPRSQDILMSSNVADVERSIR